MIFFGDSITQAGVSPTGYITKVGEMLKSKGQDSEYELIGAGIGGNKVYDLYLRLEDDVLAKKPDVVFIYVGINDVWHKASSGTGTDPDKYVNFYKALIKKLKAQKLLIYERYKGFKLSQEGRKVALQIIRKHRLWEYFLVEKLHFGWDEVHEIAEELEHISSKKLIDRLDEFLDFPKRIRMGIPSQTVREGSH